MGSTKAGSSLTLGPVRHGHGGKGRTQSRTKIERNAARSILYDQMGGGLQTHRVVFEDTLGAGIGFRKTLVVPFYFRSVSFFAFPSSPPSAEKASADGTGADVTVLP